MLTTLLFLIESARIDIEAASEAASVGAGLRETNSTGTEIVIDELLKNARDSLSTAKALLERNGLEGIKLYSMEMLGSGVLQ